MSKILLITLFSLIAINCSSNKETTQTINITPLEKELMHNVENNNLKEVKKILTQKVDVDAKNLKGETPLLKATQLNYIEIAKILLEAGANVNEQDKIQDSPFLYASAEGRTEILKEMIKYNPNVHIYNRYGGNGLIPAAEKGHLENVKILLEQTDMDVNHINRLGWTALLEAIILTNGEKTHQEIIKVLIQHGANVNIPDREGVMPLTHARKKGYTEIVEILKKAGAHE